MNCSARVLVRLLVLCASVVALAAPCEAVNNGIEPACTDTRYDGVGLILKVNNPFVSCSQNVSGTCVLIDSQTVLVARHSIIASSTSPLPTIGSRAFKVRFRRAPDGDFRNSYFAGVNNSCHGDYTEVHVHEFIRPGNGSMDVLMGRLEFPIPWIRAIPAEIESAAMPGTGEPIKVAGWGYAGPCFRTGNALTLRVASGILPTQTNGSCCVYLNPCTAPFVAGDCYACPAGGPWVVPNFLDSGAPVLVERPCAANPENPPELRVVGIVSTTNSAWRLSEWNRNGTTNTIAPPPSPCDLDAADVNHDGTVDLLDLLGFLGGWSSSNCLADVDGSGTVDVLDLLWYLGEFFA